MKPDNVGTPENDVVFDPTPKRPEPAPPPHPAPEPEVAPQDIARAAYLARATRSLWINHGGWEIVLGVYLIFGSIIAYFSAIDDHLAGFLTFLSMAMILGLITGFIFLMQKKWERSRGIVRPQKPGFWFYVMLFSVVLPMAITMGVGGSHPAIFWIFISFMYFYIAFRYQAYRFWAYLAFAFITFIVITSIMSGKTEALSGVFVYGFFNALPLIAYGAYLLLKHINDTFEFAGSENSTGNTEPKA